MNVKEHRMIKLKVLLPTLLPDSSPTCYMQSLSRSFFDNYYETVKVSMTLFINL